MFGKRPKVFWDEENCRKWSLIEVGRKVYYEKKNRELSLFEEALLVSIQNQILMSEHLNKFIKILTDLQNLDEKILDKNKALLLLNSLPDSYRHPTITLLYGKSEIIFEDVSYTLINIEYRKLNKKFYKNSSSYALMILGRSENKNQESRWAGKISL